jgi:hypothetical protein
MGRQPAVYGTDLAISLAAGVRSAGQFPGFADAQTGGRVRSMIGSL